MFFCAVFLRIRVSVAGMNISSCSHRSKMLFSSKHLGSYLGMFLSLMTWSMAVLPVLPPGCLREPVGTVRTESCLNTLSGGVSSRETGLVRVKARAAFPVFGCQIVYS